MHKLLAIEQIPVDGSGIAPLSSFNTVFSNIVELALGFAGIAFFVMLVIGGFKYITAGGDPKETQGASKTLTYAIGGLVLTALSFLVLVVIEDFTGANVTDFTIFQPALP